MAAVVVVVLPTVVWVVVVVFEHTEMVTVCGNGGFSTVPAAGALALHLTRRAAARGTVDLRERRIQPRRVAEIAVPAADCVSPTTFGTVAEQGPVDTTRLTGVFGGCWVPAAGVWEATFPAETCCEQAVVCVPTVRLAPVMVLPADVCENPTTLGTWTEDLTDRDGQLHHRRRGDRGPCGRVLREYGPRRLGARDVVDLIGQSLAGEELGRRGELLPDDRTAHVTFFTVVPALTTRLTWLFLSTLTPPAGSLEMTSPLVTAGLVSSTSWCPTARLSFCRVWVAVPTVWPATSGTVTCSVVVSARTRKKAITAEHDQEGHEQDDHPPDAPLALLLGPAGARGATSRHRRPGAGATHVERLGLPRHHDGSGRADRPR